MKNIVAAIAGATGLVGGIVLRRLLNDPAVARVVAPTRRALAPHPKLDNPLLRGSDWPALPPLDEAYACLGTTRKAAGSDASFRAVDLGLTVAFARDAKAAGARRFGLVSSIGADAGSRFLYPRTKGETEAAVSGLGFESVVIVRPSLLLGDRARPRTSELFWTAVALTLEPVMVGPLRRWRGVLAQDVASSLVAALRGRVPGTIILESESLASR